MKTNFGIRYNQFKALLGRERYALIVAALGLLGSINILFIGIHATTLYLHLAVLNRSFLARAYIMGAIAIASTLTLVFGSYLILRGRAGSGGAFNLTGGTITLMLCYYFTSAFPLLRQLGLIAYLLPAPALFSGFLALFMLRSMLEYF